ncbi:MAG TPA: DNA-3-methyladenine glycosylase [Solirubrobacteraceae bacterium]|nr:DNA-3-methyladenine glycosylase [Solirubrobacteraceae bacterium]
MAVASSTTVAGASAASATAVDAGAARVADAERRSPARRPGVQSVAFYARPVLEVARDLIGCVVEHEGLAGVIVETEAYHESEPACHAFAGVTPRTRTLFGEPGTAYVYRSYGIHALLNAVCEPQGVGAAVLIRALEPLSGIEEMRARRGRGRERGPGRRGRDGRGRDGRGRGGLARPREQDLCSGPGKLTQALGVELSKNGTSLLDGPVVIRPGERASRPLVLVGTRIGITKAVDLRWRFCAAGNAHVSRPRPDWPLGQLGLVSS